MKFDYIIQNPPYAGSLHLDIFDKTLDLLSEKGRMTIIEPATWLINVRKNGKAKKYDAIKERLKGHIYKVVIENLNKEFQVGLYVPCSITYIDMDNTYDEIEFVCCGDKKTVKSLYDCNHIGDSKLLISIFDKINNSKIDIMKNHTTKKEYDDKNLYYLPYMSIITAHGYNSQADIIKTSNGDFYGTFITPCVHKSKNIPQEHIGKTKAGNAEAVTYGTKEELENWKHFVFNNKLPLFINIVMTIDQNNNSLPFVPWLVDKQYTDDEINKLFGFTDEEIKLINNTVAKYEWHSPFYKRRMCGPTSVSDEEVQRFCDELNKNK